MTYVISVVKLSFLKIYVFLLCLFFCIRLFQYFQKKSEKKVEKLSNSAIFLKKLESKILKTQIIICCIAKIKFYICDINKNKKINLLIIRVWIEKNKCNISFSLIFTLFMVFYNQLIAIGSKSVWGYDYSTIVQKIRS